MIGKPDSKVVLVDNARRGATARILESAVARSSHSNLRFETLTVQQAQSSPIFDPESTIIFVSVTELELSVQGNGAKAPRAACESLKIAHELLQSNARLRVHLVLQAGVSEFTGIDAAAALLAGMAGVVDDRLLLADGVLDFVLGQRHLNRSSMSMLLLGGPALRLKRVKEMLDDWGMDDQSNENIDLQCFRAAMALARLDQLRPIRGQGDPYSFVKLAQALNIAESTTSFHLSKGDLRKVLSKLASRLLGDHEHSERIRLPSYVRANEFSSTPPVVKGIPEKEMAKRLFGALTVVELACHSSAEGVDLWVASLPLSEFRHPKFVGKGD